MKPTKFILFFVLSILVFSCKKDQPEMDRLNAGCDCAHEVSAEFTMEELSGQFGSDNEMWTVTDTAFAGKNVRFTALEPDANYTWYLGSEVLNDQSFARYFPDELEFQDIPVKLVVEKTPNNICFPGDDGLDSIQKILSISSSDRIDYFFGEPNDRFEGMFRFYSDHLQDSIDLKINVFDIGQNENWTLNTEHFELIDLTHNGILFDGPDTMIYMRHGKLNYRQVALRTAYGYGWIFQPSHSVDGEVIFDMRPVDYPNSEASNKLTGRKLD